MEINSYFQNIPDIIKLKTKSKVSAVKMIFQKDPNLLEASEEERTLRQTEFSHMKDICYLDYTAAGIYTQSQMDEVSKQFKTSLFSHPHGSSVISDLCASEIDQMREKILEYLGTDSDEYSVIFTSGATAAIKTVADYFQFNQGEFVYLTDNHTSVLGMRELVQTSQIHPLSVDKATNLLNNIYTKDSNSYDDVSRNSLFVYPAQSNFSGRKYPLSWISNIRNCSQPTEENNSPKSNWFVLLDAATYCSTNKLSLKLHKPDFLCISFYKLFGYPTGLGALIVRKSSAHVLNKTYYGGGTVKIALATENFHKKKDNISENFEDGTVNYLAIISLRHGFGCRAILYKDSDRIFEMAQYTYRYLKHLYYPNQRKAVQLYHDNDYSSSNNQGNIVNFNILRNDGTFYGYSEVQNIANLMKIQLRTGCHCNPGSCQRFLGLSDELVKYHFQQGHVCGDDKDIIDGRPTGSVRISYGYASNWDDVKYFLSFLQQYFLQDAAFISPDTISEIDQINVGKMSLHENEMKEDKVENTDLEGKLEKIYLYPVKACGYYEVKTKWAVNSSGLSYDRQWMIVNKTGVVLTQKLEKKLCLIQPNFDFKRKKLTLCYRSSGSAIEVPLENDETNEKYSSLCKSKVCSDSITGYDCGDEVAFWLDSQLNHTGLRLFRLKQRSGTRNLNSLSNMGQYLLITLPSVQAQLEKVAYKSNVYFDHVSFTNRFRSNFVVSGEFKANTEIDWSDVLIETKEGLVAFEVKKQCVRCQYIYIDQDTGHVTDVPLNITKFGVYISNNFSLEKGEFFYLNVGDKVFCKTKSK